MNTTRTNNETLNENAKAVETLFNNTNSTIMELYKKQMDFMSGFYGNFFKTSLGNTNPWNGTGGFPNLYLGTDMMKWFSNPLALFSNNDIHNPFLGSIESAMKQLTTFNQNLLSTLSGGTQGTNFNWGSMSEKYKSTLLSQLETSKKMYDTISDAFNRQLESSMETNIKVTEEIRKQYNLVLKQNQKLWDDIFKTYHVPHNGEESRTKEHHSHDHKRHSKVAEHELQHH